VLKKATTDRSLLFIILMRPVTTAAPDMPMTTIITTRAGTGLNLGADGSKGNKAPPNAKNKMEATANPADHLPKGVFGKIAIPTLL